MCHSVTVSHHGYQKFLTDTPGPEFPVPGGYPTHQNSASVNSPFRRELVIGVLRRTSATTAVLCCKVHAAVVPACAPPHRPTLLVCAQLRCRRPLICPVRSLTLRLSLILVDRLFVAPRTTPKEGMTKSTSISCGYSRGCASA